ncbi:MAG: hypothetical protein KF890_13610, partial [Nitrospira sp.]|nr:hypothetical protein [Nitrospira sp.]
MTTHGVPTETHHRMEIEQSLGHPIMARLSRLSILAGFLVFPGALLGMESPVRAQDLTATLSHASHYNGSEESSRTDTIPITDTPDLPNDDIYDTTESDTSNTSDLSEHPAEQFDDANWQELTVTKGDSLARIFKRLHLSPQDLHTIMTLGKETSVLKRLKPGQVMWFQVVEQQFVALKYPVDLVTTLHVAKKDEGIQATTITEELETRINHATVTITDSL